MAMTAERLDQIETQAAIMAMSTSSVVYSNTIELVREVKRLQAELAKAQTKNAEQGWIMEAQRNELDDLHHDDWI